MQMKGWQKISTVRIHWIPSSMEKPSLPYPKNEDRTDNITWWDHNMGTLPHFWPFVRRNHQFLVNSPNKESMMWRFDVFFVVSLQNCWKKSNCEWFKTPWCYCEITVMILHIFVTSNFSHTFICSHWIPCFNLIFTTLFGHILYSH